MLKHTSSNVTADGQSGTMALLFLITGELFRRAHKSEARNSEVVINVLSPV